MRLSILHSLLSLPRASLTDLTINSYTTMEACFLTLKSFTKTIELVPSIKSTILNSTKRKTYRARVPSSITCCHAESSSSKQASDWRSFRARLVAAEPSLLEDPDTVVEQTTLEDEWVHEIHEPEKGCILFATEKFVGDRNIERPVILLLSTGPEGSIGILLDQPLRMSIKEMKSPVLDVGGSPFADSPLFCGGPLKEVVFLVKPKESENVSEVFDEVMKDLYYGMCG